MRDEGLVWVVVPSSPFCAKGDRTPELRLNEASQLSAKSPANERMGDKDSTREKEKKTRASRYQQSASLIRGLLLVSTIFIFTQVTFKFGLDVKMVSSSAGLPQGDF